VADARGNYVFKGLDLGSYKVVVMRPDGSQGVMSRTVTITRGVEIRDNDVAVAPKPAAPPTSRPVAPPTTRPSAPPPRVAVFAALGAGDVKGGLRS
jgi:hypothetical protein